MTCIGIKLQPSHAAGKSIWIQQVTANSKYDEQLKKRNKTLMQQRWKLQKLVPGAILSSMRCGWGAGSGRGADFSRFLGDDSMVNGKNQRGKRVARCSSVMWFLGVRIRAKMTKIHNENDLRVRIRSGYKSSISRCKIDIFARKLVASSRCNLVNLMKKSISRCKKQHWLKIDFKV